jgi:CBS domain-containing protein
MKVADLMHTTLVTVVSDSMVSEAVLSLADAHVTGLPVVDVTGRLVGVLSTSDVLTALAEQDEPDARTAVFENTAVRELMTPRPVTIAPDAEVREAAQQMLYANVHRLFVEEAGALVGVISQSDIVRAVATARV